MKGIFGRLQERIEAERHKEGISSLDLASLPPVSEKIMRFLLKEFELTHEELHNWAAGLPEEEKISPESLDLALDALSKNFWIIRRGEGSRLRYQVNLRRKAGITSGKEIWVVLTDKIFGDASNHKDDNGN